MSNTWTRGIHIQMNTKHNEVMLGTGYFGKWKNRVLEF